MTPAICKIRILKVGSNQNSIEIQKFLKKNDSISKLERLTMADSPMMILAEEDAMT